ncbi:MAG: sigma-54-dependent Fis family transcriptional regulator [Deltaproteobacteria bacterium]|nr:sigma-54-dependent Fis family transcriptional regulator [Deltaproteobacteria bacterium]
MSLVTVSQEKKKVLIVDDESGMRHMLSVLLEREGYHIDSAQDGKEGLEKIKLNTYDLVLCDIRMPEMDGLTFLESTKNLNRSIPVIMMSAFGNVDTAIEAMKKGAYDYVSKPFKADEILLRLQRLTAQENLMFENQSLKRVLHQETSFSNIIARSPRMLEIFDTIRKIADYKTTVLISGESGSGKELIARAIHFNSPRANKPFIAINCSAIPENLLESELFGYMKGSFTGANKDKKGLFEEAHGGTLFLDEVGDLPLSLQVKLLRAIQEEEIRRVGASNIIKIDVRLITATLKNLGEEIKKGTFREDLYYRLNVLPIHLPPLRERKEDIPLLVDVFLKRFAKEMNKSIEKVSAECMQFLTDYSWPGNVRELENTIERSMVLETHSELVPEHLPDAVRNVEINPAIRAAANELSIKKMMVIMEQELIKKALDKTGGNRTWAAKLLEISHRALLYKIKRYGLERYMLDKDPGLQYK